MSNKSTIEWTGTPQADGSVIPGASWNPVLGCSKVSAGCAHCYAVGQVHRMAGNPNATIAAANAGLTARHRNGQLDWTGVVRLIPDRLSLPLTWTTPRRVFVNSLSDLFHEALTDDEIARVWAVMALTPHITYQVLTKRPERARSLLSDPGFYGLVLDASKHWRAEYPETLRIALSDPGWFPKEHIWLGTSVEDQTAAEERIPHLLAAPAAVRFLSCEPLLGPIDLDRLLWEVTYADDGDGDVCGEWELRAPGIDWVIVGGESGPGARPIEADWVNGLIEQCIEADIPVFCKQTGTVWAKEHGYKDRKGGSPEEWPRAWRIREYPCDGRQA